MSNEKSLENLFVSKVRLKALKFFTLNYSRSIHLRGAVRELDEEINAVRRELVRLEEVKILTTETQANRKYFKLNFAHPYVEELMSMFHKAYGLGGEIVQSSKRLGDIDYAFLTPSFTKGFYFGEQIVDLVVIGTVDVAALDELVKKFEERTGKEVHYTVLKPSEYAIRKRRKDKFLYDLLLQDIIMLVGRKDELIR